MLKLVNEIHKFTFRLYAEVRRVLRPKGVFAVYAYNCDRTEAFKAVLQVNGIDFKYQLLHNNSCQKQVKTMHMIQQKLMMFNQKCVNLP